MLRPGKISRRSVARTAVTAAAGYTTLAGTAAAIQDESPQTTAPAIDPDFKISKGRIRQSVMGWCFNPMPTSDLIGHCLSIGLTGIEGIDRKFTRKPAAEDCRFPSSAAMVSPQARWIAAITPNAKQNCEQPSIRPPSFNAQKSSHSPA